MTDNISLSDNERIDYINEDLTLIQSKTGLTFGTDAYLLSAFVREKGVSGADIGSGTGVASLLCITKGKATHMHAIEVQEYFADLTKRNAKLNNLYDKLSVICDDARNVNESTIGTTLDIVISNPPYMKAHGGFSTKSTEMNIARREMNGTIKDFCLCASRLLKFGGIFYTVYRPDRLCDLIAALKEANLEPKKLVTVYPDTSSKPCLVLCMSKKGAASDVTIARPLFIYKDGTREYTDDMNKIYDNCSLEHLF